MALRPQAVDKCCTDIACKPNGHADAIAFIRVHFASGDPRNTIIGPLYPGTTRWTNNRVHLTAILEALNILRTSTYKELEILTHNKLTVYICISLTCHKQTNKQTKTNKQTHTHTHTQTSLSLTHAHTHTHTHTGNWHGHASGISKAWVLHSQRQRFGKQGAK